MFRYSPAWRWSLLWELWKTIKDGRTMSSIGIMGGTFNPIHNVHLIMAEEARTQFHLEHVLFMPSKNPPHKEKEVIASDEHRKRMIQHAIQGNPYFSFSDLELKREGTTYTKDTLALLRHKHPQDTFFFIVGGDSLAAMDNWCEPEFIFQNCHVLAANRDETTKDELNKWMVYYKDKYGAQISEIKMPSISISSEMIREKIISGKSITDYCPVPVERYIRSNCLYGAGGRLFSGDIEEMEIIEYLAANLKPKRFTHTLGVAVTAANIAAVHGCDVKKAYLAGLLHDCAKYLTGNELIEQCKKADIPLSEVELSNTALIHGKVGAYFARTKYEVKEEDILSAIAYHTTGRPGMSMLEKIVYLADYMEPGRNMKCRPYSLEKIRKACYTDLDKALIMVLECCVTYLKKCGDPIDPLTIETYQYYKK